MQVLNINLVLDLVLDDLFGLMWCLVGSKSYCKWPCGVVDETAADYESRSLMQFCKSHLLLLADYELLRDQHMSVTGSESSSSEPDVKSVG